MLLCWRLLITLNMMMSYFWLTAITIAILLMIPPAISLVFGFFIPKCKAKSKCFHHKWYYHSGNDLSKSSKGDIYSQMQWKSITLRIRAMHMHSHVSKVLHIKALRWLMLESSGVTNLHYVWMCACIRYTYLFSANTKRTTDAHSILVALRVHSRQQKNWGIFLS